LARQRPCYGKVVGRHDSGAKAVKVIWPALGGSPRLWSSHDPLLPEALVSAMGRKQTLGQSIRPRGE
jgi:hypothetical protein